MNSQRRSLATCAAISVAALAAMSPALADDNGSRVFAVTFQEDTASQTVTRREFLAIGSQAGKPFVRISNGVASTSFAADVGSDGEIANDGADAGLICYNMATSVVAAYDKDPNSPVRLYVRFLDKIVAIPLTVNAQDAEGTNVLSFAGHDTGEISSGKTAVASALLVSGKIEETHGAIATAAFDEATVAGSPAGRIGGISCSLTQLPQNI